jgi:TolB-like protein
LSFFNELKRRNVFKVAFAYVVVGWLVAQVLQLIFESFGTPEWVMKTVLVLMAAGLLFALFFAWAFEMTPEGLKKESEVDRTQSITPQTGKKLNNLIVALMALALGYFAYDKFVLSTNRDAALVEATTQAVTQLTNTEDAELESDASIAVLPFVNMSDDAGNEYFSDGLSEELLNLLAKIPELRVIARTSSFAYKGSNTKISDVARELNVDHVLEGSVRKAGKRVRITAQLILASDSSHLWSETYDRSLDDIFAIQDEISAAIVVALKDTLGIDIPTSEIARESIDPDAHNEYLLGVYNMEQRTKDSLEAAVNHFEQAIEIEPDYAAAHARLAITFGLLPGYSDDLNRNDYYEMALPHSQRAMELAPDTWEANLAMGYNLWSKSNLFGNDLDEAIPYLRKGLELNPSYGPAYSWLSSVQRIKGDYEGGNATLEEGIKVAPLDRVLLGSIANSYIYLDRFEEAEKTIERLMDIAPEMALNRAATLATRQGRWADNAISLIHYLSLAPTSSSYWTRRIVSEDLGLPEEALTIGEQDSNYRVYILLGQPQEAIKRAWDDLESEPNLGNKWTLGTMHAMSGEMESAHTYFETVMTESEDLDGWVPSTSQIAARVAVGDLEGARLLAQLLDEDLDTRRAAGIDVAPGYLNEGYAHYLIGEKDAGLAALAKVVELGFYVPVFQAYLKELRSDPGFAPLLAKQQAKQSVEREKFLAVMCGLDNPVPNFWRPSESACK